MFFLSLKTPAGSERLTHWEFDVTCFLHCLFVLLHNPIEGRRRLERPVLVTEIFTN